MSAALLVPVAHVTRKVPRVVLISDTFHEVNGAARTCREWEAFARRRQWPFLNVRWGRKHELANDGAVRSLELVRSRWVFQLDPDLYFDPFFYRLLSTVEAEVARFQPDVIHITSPGDLGIAGAIVAAHLRKPLALSWHTNIHEFAARRVSRTLGWLPSVIRDTVSRGVEDFVMNAVCWFFGRGQVLFAPNPNLIATVQARTGERVFPMGRGVDSTLFNPERRLRADTGLVIGFVGRLMPEKNLRLLVQGANALRQAGIHNVRFQITGSGDEREWLQRHLPGAIFTGVLSGEALARAYANMDIFAFPSRTDTFGNVVQEALASGVPAVVTDAGGPRFIVRQGVTGLIASSDGEFCESIVTLAQDRNLRAQMGSAARRQMINQSWDAIFEELYDGYASVLQNV